MVHSGIHMAGCGLKRTEQKGSLRKKDEGEKPATLLLIMKCTGYCSHYLLDIHNHPMSCTILLYICYIILRQSCYVTQIGLVFLLPQSPETRD